MFQSVRKSKERIQQCNNNFLVVIFLVLFFTRLLIFCRLVIKILQYYYLIIITICRLKWILISGLCSNSFNDKSSMSNHIESHKNDKMCLLCKEKFSEWQQLFSHRLEHVQCKDKICHICFKRFKSSPYLEYHYKNIHSVNEVIDFVTSFWFLLRT